MSQKRRLLELDSLRGLAALGVCLFHFDVFKYGVAGVDLFFMISGFVIFMSVSNGDSIKSFWVSRVIRLFPSYWISIVIAIVCTLLLVHDKIQLKWNFVLGNVLMLQPLFKTTCLVGVYWTLYVELTFYILISLIWYLKKLYYIEGIILAGLLLMALLNGTYSIVQNHSPAFVHVFIVLRSLIPLIVNHFTTFSSGIIFYLIYKNGYSVFRCSLLLLSLVVTAIAHNYSVMINSFLNVYEHLFILILFYALFFLITKNDLNILKIRILIVLGNSSYVIYLIHQSFGLDIRFLLTPVVGLFFSNVISVLVVISLSVLITYYIDVPIRNWLRKKYQRVYAQPRIS